MSRLDTEHRLRVDRQQQFMELRQLTVDLDDKISAIKKAKVERNLTSY